MSIPSFMAGAAYTRYNDWQMVDPATEPLPPRLFVVDGHAERSERDTRLWAALVAACGGIWLFSTGSNNAVTSGFALAGVAFAMIWTMGWIRKRVNDFEVDGRYLQLGDDGLQYSDGRMVTAVGWDELRSVSVDEDRLHVCLAVDSGEELRLQDTYDGATPHQLAEIIHQFHEHARMCTPPADG